MHISYKFKKPILKNKKYIENFFIKKGLRLLVDLSKKKKLSVNEMTSNEPYIPELGDLYNLYQYVLINKRTTVFEFGSGWSTLIFSLALKELRDKFFDEVKLLRRNNKFELFVVEPINTFRAPDVKEYPASLPIQTVPSESASLRVYPAP